MNQDKIIIYQTKDGLTDIQVRFEEDTVWLNRSQMAELFGRDIKTIGKHISNAKKEELLGIPVVANFATTASDGKVYQVEYYNIEMISSVGYRVKSKQGVQFRIWANSILKEYLLKGYAINESRIAQKELELENLRAGIRILSRAIEDKSSDEGFDCLDIYAEGLKLLDDFDHERLDKEGDLKGEVIYPDFSEYVQLITNMCDDFDSDVFGKERTGGFRSALAQIQQSFAGQQLYPSLEEKAATLLYLIVKNHAFVDGNKRIGAACFLLFLTRNNLIKDGLQNLIISNEALASLTLFIAVSKPEEMSIVKALTVSILKRNGSMRN